MIFLEDQEKHHISINHITVSKQKVLISRNQLLISLSSSIYMGLDAIILSFKELQEHNQQMK